MAVQGGGSDATAAALAEFGALRTEIGNCQTIQGAVVGVGLTAVGLVSTAALQDGGDRQLLLAGPPIALAACILYAAEWVRMFRAGGYIRDVVWPYLQDQTGYPFSWEMHHAQASDMKGARLFAAIIFDGIVPLLFTLVGIGTMLYSGLRRGTAYHLGLTCIVLTVLVPVMIGGQRMLVGRRLKKEREKKEEAERNSRAAESTQPLGTV